MSKPVRRIAPRQFGHGTVLLILSPLPREFFTGQPGSRGTDMKAAGFPAWQSSEELRRAGAVDGVRSRGFGQRPTRDATVLARSYGSTGFIRNASNPRSV